MPDDTTAYHPPGEVKEHAAFATPAELSPRGPVFTSRALDYNGPFPVSNPFFIGGETRVSASVFGLSTAASVSVSRLAQNPQATGDAL